MGREFKLPDLGSGLQEGEIVRWAVAVGDSVSTEDVLCEVETEKAVIEIPVPWDGVVSRLACAEGERLNVGETLVVFDAGDQTEDTPAKDSIVDENRAAADVPEPSRTGTATGNNGKRPRAMPSIRRIARERGIDLATINGTGRNGRITRADVENATKPEMQPDIVMPVSGQHKKFSMMRKTIADHMTRSWREIPHVFVRKRIDASGLLGARKALGEEMGRKIPLEAFLVGAVLPALRAQPEFNAVVDNDGITYHDRFDIGTAANTPDGLVVPVVRNAASLSWEELVDDISALQQRALQRQSTPDELQGATFTVNNIGALGTAMGTSIIQHGTTAILALGRASEEAVVVDGDIVVRPMAELALAFDHRAIDGGGAGRFIDRVASLLENPVRGFVA